MKWTSRCGNQHSRKASSSHTAPPSTQAQCWVPLPHAHRPDTSTPSTPSICGGAALPVRREHTTRDRRRVAVDLRGTLLGQEGCHRGGGRSDHRAPARRPVGVRHGGDRLDHRHRVDLWSAVRSREAHPHEVGIDQCLHGRRGQTPRLLGLVGMGFDDLCEVGGSFDDSGRHLDDCRRRARRGRTAHRRWNGSCAGDRAELCRPAARRRQRSHRRARRPGWGTVEA